MDESIYIVYGGATALILLVSMWMVPYTPIKFGIIELDRSPFYEEKPAGIRFQIGNFRVHHYMIGLIILALGTPIAIKWDKKLGYFMIGFGTVLVVDQLPNLISGTWGTTEMLSYVFHSAMARW